MINKIISLLGKPLVEIIRNRLLNKHTPKGISLIVTVGVAMGYLKEPDANLIISLLSGMNVTYTDMWLLGVNAALVYLAYRAVKLIVRTSDCFFEDKIISKWKDNDKDNRNSISS